MKNSASLDEINQYMAISNPGNNKCAKAYVRINDGIRPKGFGKAFNPKFGYAIR